MSDIVFDYLCRSFSAEPLQNGQRRWRDGSLEEDLPMRSLSEMFNVNYFLVSQTNPHIVPVLNLKKRVNRKLGNILEAEWKHRSARLMPCPVQACPRASGWDLASVGRGCSCCTPLSAQIWQGLPV